MMSTRFRSQPLAVHFARLGVLALVLSALMALTAGRVGAAGAVPEVTDTRGGETATFHITTPLAANRYDVLISKTPPVWMDGYYYFPNVLDQKIKPGPVTAWSPTFGNLTPGTKYYFLVRTLYPNEPDTKYWKFGTFQTL